MGRIEAICISEKKGITKTAIEKAELIENHGIKGDAHAGKWHRQVSILSKPSIDRMKEKLPQIIDGSFAENLVVSEIDLKSVKIGSKIFIENDIILEVTQIGKKCHDKCIIGQTTGECIMPTEGVFTKVLKGGKIHVGSSVSL